MALIGREPPADIVVRAPEVSARHAEIVHLHDDQYQLSDLGSTNGTYVNGQRIQSAVVTPADHIELGSCPFDLSAWLSMILPADAGHAQAPSYAPPPAAPPYAPPPPPASYSPPAPSSYSPPAPASYSPPPPVPSYAPPASYAPPPPAAPAPYLPPPPAYSPPPPYSPSPSAAFPPAGASYGPGGDATYGGAPPPYEPYAAAPPYPSAAMPTSAAPPASTGPAFLFVPPVLRAIEGGATFRNVFAWILRIAAGLVALGAVVGSGGMWMAASEMGGKAIAGALLFQVLLIVGVYAIVHTVLIRATDIANLPHCEFVVIPIFTVYLRLIGEVLAWCFVTFGFGGGLLALLSLSPAGMGGLGGSLPGLSLSAGGGAVGALMAMATGIGVAFGALLFFYLLAELVSVTVAIARNTEAIRKQGEQAAKDAAAGV